MDAECDNFATGLSTCITKDGQTTITADIPFANHKITGLASATSGTDAATFAQVQSQASTGATVGGTADAITLTVSPSIAAYAALQRFRFVATATNTGAVTVAVSGLATKAIQANGAALVAGDIVDTRTYEIIYDGTAFQLFSSKAAVLHTADIADSAISTAKIADLAVTAAKLPVIIRTGGVRAVTGTSDTILAADRGKLVTFSNAGAIAVTLPQATTDFTTPFMFSAQNLGAGLVTITPSTSTIDGAATLTLSQNNGVEIFSDGTNYYTQRGRAPAVTSYAVVASSPAAITTSSTDELTHGLGAAPHDFGAYIIMGASTEHGYTEGMRVDFDKLGLSGSSARSTVVYADATKVYVTWGSSAPSVLNLSTFTESIIDVTKWTVVLWARPN